MTEGAEETAKRDLLEQFEMAVNLFVKTTPQAHIEGILATSAQYRDHYRDVLRQSAPVDPAEFVASIEAAERDPDQFPEPWGATFVELLDGLVTSAIMEENLQPATVIDALDEWVERSHEEAKDAYDLPDGFFEDAVAGGHDG